MKTFFTSWSGGKDCTLAHYLAQADGFTPKALFSMCRETKDMSRSHGLPTAFLKAQSQAMGLPCVFGYSTWGGYEAAFVDQLKLFKSEGIDYGVYGDMDLVPHRAWQEMVCKRADMEAVMPLWLKGREANTRQFLDLGFKAIITSIQLEKVDRSYLGQILTHEIVDRMKNDGIDPSGEGGEFHTAVIDGPLFSNPINIEIKGKDFEDTHGYIRYEI